MKINDIFKIIFVHSYSSEADNWQEVVIGSDKMYGRLTLALKLASELNIPIVTNDMLDLKNIELYKKYNIFNLKTARNTKDEVLSVLEYEKQGGILFISSPDHLPRVVRDVLICRGYRCYFRSSDVEMSKSGVNEVVVEEPPHKKIGDI